MNCEEETFSLHVDSPCHSQMQSSSMLRWLRTPESGKIQIGNHPYHVAKKEQHHQLCTTTQKAREGRRETAATGRHSRPKRMTSMTLHIAQVMDLGRYHVWRCKRRGQGIREEESGLDAMRICAPDAVKGTDTVHLWPGSHVIGPRLRCFVPIALQGVGVIASKCGVRLLRNPVRPTREGCE